MACAIEGCGRPRYQRRIYCGSHTMRLYRYGDPLATAPSRKSQDITGHRFGSLVALSRQAGSRWLCRCDCGNEKSILIGDLNRGSTVSCGERPTHPRKQVVTYAGAHDRVTAAKGRAADQVCVDCAGPAAHWSYDHLDPNELTEMVDVQGGRWSYLVAYSINPAHYAPRCVPCHRRYDTNRTDAHVVA